MNPIVQVVNGDGDFAESHLQDFFKNNGVENSGVNYTIVAIMGPQSSGKSTLLNHLVRLITLNYQSLPTTRPFQHTFAPFPF